MPINRISFFSGTSSFPGLPPAAQAEPLSYRGAKLEGLLIFFFRPLHAIYYITSPGFFNRESAGWAFADFADCAIDAEDRVIFLRSFLGGRG
jgi:hypothetical protein